LAFKERGNIPSSSNKLYKLVNVNFGKRKLTTSSWGSFLTLTIGKVSFAMDVTYNPSFL